jgi:hypothetical protein
MREELRKDIRDIQKVVVAMDAWLRKHPETMEIPLSKLKIEGLSSLRICELAKKYAAELNGSYVKPPSLCGEGHNSVFEVQEWKSKVR